MLNKIIDIVKNFLSRRKTKHLERYLSLYEQINEANAILDSILTEKSCFFSHSQMESWRESNRPLLSALGKGKKHLKLGLPFEVVEAIEKFKNFSQNIKSIRDDYNASFIETEKVKYKALFDNVEGRALDDQQRDCIVKDETNNLVVAGAGSGKTTTIVGKVKYLLAKSWKPQELLVLSYTNASASEMAERIKSETGKDIDAMTFHKLGKEIIAEVEGKQPTITGIDLDTYTQEKFKEFLKDNNFLAAVNKFYLFYLKEYRSQFDFQTKGDYYDYLRDKKIKTLKNEVVKSYEEKDIADFLSTNSINYNYEKQYEKKTANKEYGQYIPDFYLPDYQIYIEHFGVDRKGNVPPFFKGAGQLSAKDRYNEGMKWKRETHKDNGTILVETYSFEKMEGVLLENLKEKLENRGVISNPIPPEEVWKQQIKDKNSDLYNFIKLISTFIVNMKSGGNSIEDLLSKNQSQFTGYEKRRNEAFLEIVTPIYNDYINQLSSNDEIDFSDMINRAAAYVEEERYAKRYSYIIVDEYQDISLPRYKLIKAIKDFNSSKLLCVGDDWQSIYRFAGSDISLFTDFEKFFGYTEKSLIETTYRFNQSLIELSGNLIMKNKSQIAKNLRCPRESSDPSHEIIYGEDSKVLTLELKQRLKSLSPKSNVIFLGRYNDDLKQYIDAELKSKYHHHQNKYVVTYNQRMDLNIEFLTVHRSKGLQADYVFVLNNIDERKGFPSTMADDKVLNLVTIEREKYEHAEERRLFYVALTRAKKFVYLLVDNTCKSVFIKELEKESCQSRNEPQRNSCPECQTGQLVKRAGQYGEFYGCTNYPHCKYHKKAI